MLLNSVHRKQIRLCNETASFETNCACVPHSSLHIVIQDGRAILHIVIQDGLAMLHIVIQDG